jgi:hypothetical protein
MSALVNYGVIDPNLTQGAMTKGYNAYIDRGNALVQQERANKLADLQYNQAMDAENQRRALQSYMANKDPSAPDFERGLGMIVGPQGMVDYRTKQAGAKKADLDLRMKQDDFLDKLKRNLSSNPSDENVISWGQDAVIEKLYSAEEAEATVQELLRMTPEKRAEVLSQSGASASDLKPSTLQVNRGGQTDVIERPAFGGAPTTVGTYADVPLPENVVAQKRDIAQAGRPEGARVYLPPQPKAEQEKRGELLVKQYGAVSDQAGIAIKTLPAIQSNLKVLENGFNTGFGTEAQAAAAKVLGALGVQDAEKYATTAQIFNANATQAVLQRQLEQKGPQTESDAQRIKETGAQLGNTAGGNKFMLTVAQEQLKRDVEQRNFYDKWWKSNKTYDGAEDAWYEGDGGKSLFDRPALKKFGAANESTAARIPGARTVARTGTLNGRKVIEYSDGTIEYGN